jgi:hypothetical protein
MLRRHDPVSRALRRVLHRALDQPAGVRCPHLTEEIRCALFGRPERPAVCRDLMPGPEMCGGSAEEALATLTRWERETAP